MANISKSFNWKRIEEKPDNYEAVSTLIDRVANIDENENLYNIKQNDNVLEAFIKKFGMNEWFQDVSFTNEKKKSKKKADIIRENNEKTHIEKDFQLFSVDEKFKIKKQIFIIPINNYLYILWWCFQIFKKDSKKIKSLVKLDATISLNRILLSGMITNPKYLAGFKKGDEVMNSLVKKKYYDLLFDNPKLLLQSSFQEQDKQIDLYPEQKLVLRKIKTAIENNEPLLLGNQLPTGQGKTFMAVLLAKMLSYERNIEKKKCVLFTCPNELVNIDVAANTLCGNSLHLWLAKYIIVEKVDKKTNQKYKVIQTLLRPYRRCFPSTWKQVYKKDDDKKVGTIEEQFYYYVRQTGRIPDIIVADPEACYQILKSSEQMDNPFIAYVDEFVSDKNSNEAMVKIARVLPRQSILLSSILPKFEYLSKMVSNFCNEHSTSEELCSYRVSSADVNIPCVIVDHKGSVRLPHHHVNTINDLDKLIEQMEKNPRIRRTYSPKHVYYWSLDISDILPSNLKFQKNFPCIGSINLRNVIIYVVSLLNFLKDNFHLLEKFKNYRPSIMPDIDIFKLFTTQTCYYEGKTLFITNNVIQKTLDYTNELYNSPKYVKIDKLLTERENQTKMLQKQKKTISSFTTNKKSSTSKEKQHSSLNTLIQQSELDESITRTDVKIPKEFVVNSLEHFKRFHPSIDIETFSNCNDVNIYLDDEYFEHFTDSDLYQMMSGIGLYDKNGQTEYQRNMIMKLYKYFSFFGSGMDIVYGTNLSSLVNIMIDYEFGKDVSIPTLYQLMGRVGRMGRSYHANIITNHENIVEKLLSLDDNDEKHNDIELLF
jgi:hypothetical protein